MNRNFISSEEITIIPRINYRTAFQKYIARIGKISVNLSSVGSIPAARLSFGSRLPFI